MDNTIVSNGGEEPSSSSSWMEFEILTQRIRSGDDAAAGEFYWKVHRGLRAILYRQLGFDSEDAVQDTFLATLKAIRDGKVDDPRRIVGYMNGIARNMVRGEIALRKEGRQRFVSVEADDLSIPAREKADAEHEYKTKIEFARQVLMELSARDREVLTRFYLHEESQDHIIQEMQLTETQFRLLKSRAKARFTELSRKRMNPSPLRRRVVAAGA
jgi:RNA polymerase sigma-70 factor (ECF subfamily)